MGTTRDTIRLEIKMVTRDTLGLERNMDRAMVNSLKIKLPYQPLPFFPKPFLHS